MTAVISPPAVDGDVLMGFVFRAIDEVGASLNTALVVMGDRLGLYKALAQAGPTSPAEPCAPRHRRPSMTIPAPMPVPSLTIITFDCSRAAPARSSPRARTLTSLSTQTGAL